MPRRPSDKPTGSPSPSPSSKPPRSSSGGSSESGKSAEINAINAQIEEVEIEIARTRLTDKQAELSHKQNILAVKGNIRSLTEEQWNGKQEIAQVGVQISALKVDGANDKLSVEQELLGVSKTLGEERIAKARRKLYEIHEFEGVEG